MSYSRRHHRKGALSSWELHYGPNMTPMVDVVMVILVFFMASTAVLGPEWFLKSALPVVNKNAAANPEVSKQTRLSFELTTGAGSGARFTGAGLTDAPHAEFVARVRQAVQEVGKENVVVLFAPAPDVHYQAVVSAHEACRRLGIDKVGMREKAEAPK